jgi:hypothetical protein
MVSGSLEREHREGLDAGSLSGSEIMARAERGIQELGRPMPLPGIGVERYNKRKAA